MSFENLSDEEIMMVEQLTYFDDIGEKHEGQTLETIIKDITSGEIDVSGWLYEDEAIAICDYIMGNKDLRNLVLQDVVKDDGSTLSCCFTENVENPVEAIVAFKGTTKNEWVDNFEGFAVSDTERQIEAKEYIDSLDYDYITVTGHSKGGNKAMYTSVLCENVDRCISMDGQGFSQEFYEKYGNEVSERAHLIKNYSVKSDFVHIALFQMPGSEQIYCEGFRLDSIPAAHHKSSSFFNIVGENPPKIETQNGVPIVVTEINGEPIQEDPSVTMLHNFTCYLVNVAPDKDKEKIIEVVGTLVDLAITGGEDKVSKICLYIGDNEENLSLVLAYLVKYMDTYDLSADEIDGLIKMLGLDSLGDIKKVISIIQENLLDGSNDYILCLLAAFLDDLYNEATGASLDLPKLWGLIEKKINSIPNVSKKDGLREPQIITTSKGSSTISAGPIIEVDTNKLRMYADRLGVINKRIVEVDKRLQDLYLKVDIQDLFYLVQADFMTRYNKKLSKCGIFLDMTANAFEFTEKKVKDLF